MISSDPVALAVGAGVCGVLGLFALVVAGRTFPSAVRWCAGISTLVAVIAGTAIWFAFPELVVPDAAGYQREALAVLDHWSGRRAESPRLSPGKEGFVYVLVTLYRTVGVTALVGLVLNAALAGLLVYVVADTTRLFSERAMKWAAGITAFSPPFLWWSAQLLRDPAAWLLLSIAVNATIRILRSGANARRLGALGASLASMMTIRASVGVIVAVGLVAAFVLASEHHRAAKGVAAALATAAFLFAVGQYEGVSRLAEIDTGEVVQSRNALIREANSSFGQQTSASPSELIRAAATSVVPVTVGPLPWRLGSSGLPAVADVVTWWLALLLAWRGWRSLGGRRSEALALILPALAILAVLMVTSGNYGTMIRIRAQSLVIIVPLVAVGMVSSLERWREEPAEAPKAPIAAADGAVRPEARRHHLPTTREHAHRSGGTAQSLWS